MRFPYIPNKFSLFVVISALAFSALLPVSVSSEILRWKGSVDERFSNAANWEPSRLPSLKDNLIFNGDAKRGCRLESNVSVSSVKFTRLFKYWFSFGKFTLTTRGPVSDFCGLKTAKNATGALQCSSADSAQTILLSPTGSLRLQSLIIDNNYGVACIAAVNRLRSGTVTQDPPLDATFETLKLKRGGLRLDPLPSGASVTFRSIDATPAFRVITVRDTQVLKPGSYLSTRDLPAGALLIEPCKPVFADTAVSKTGPVVPAVRIAAPAAAPGRTSDTPKKTDSTNTDAYPPSRTGSARTARAAVLPADSLAGASKVQSSLLNDTAVKPPSDTSRTRAQSVHVDLGGVRLGSPIDTVLSFINIGPDTLRVSSTSVQWRSLTIACDTLIVPPGDTAYDSVRFSPTALSRDSIIFIARKPAVADTVTVFGYGKAAWSALSPDTIRIKKAQGDMPSRAFFTRKNMGTDTLCMREILCISDSSAFSESILVVSNLRPVPLGDTSIDTIMFYRSKSQSDTVTVVLKSNSIGLFDTLVLIAGAGQPAAAVRQPPPNTPREFSFSGVLMGNHKVLFSFTLSAFCRVRLEICNAIGQAVQLLVNGFMDAGIHELTWEAPAYAKGVYFCRFKAADAIDGNVMFGKTARVIF